MTSVKLGNPEFHSGFEKPGGGGHRGRMSLSTFRDHIERNAAPDPTWPPEVQALWWEAKGDWEKAHQCTQQDGGGTRCDHVHAYLHRKEGDLANAGYWYQRAGTTAPEDQSLDEEWGQLVEGVFP